MPLYHYTDLMAIRSILCHKKMRLTDIRYLNDSNEHNDGLLILLKSFDALESTFCTGDQYSQRALGYLRNEISNTLKCGLTGEMLCACSFSRSRNQLSQWRAYGSYEIEFDEEVLSTFLELHDCTYRAKEKNDRALAYVAKSIDAICMYMSQNEGRWGVSGIDELIRITQMAATFKDEGFIEENEVRALDSLLESDPNIEYRDRGNILVPYIEKDISLDCIKAIHVGPMTHQQLAYQSMYNLVKSVEMEHQSYSGNIEFELDVSMSSIPYRTF